MPNEPDPATKMGEHHLLRFTARCLSNQSLLHIGYRSITDREDLVTERHKYNIHKVDGMIKKSEYVVASPQQQKAIASFTAFSGQRHLVLTGPAGTGKTVVALQVANNLVQELEDNAEPGKGPALVVTTQFRENYNPISKYLDASTNKAKEKIVDTWKQIKMECGIRRGGYDKLPEVSKALTEKYEGRPIVILIDEILRPELILNSLVGQRHSFPANVRIIAVVNPLNSSLLPPLSLCPEFVLHLNLTTSYRSTIAITSLSRFLAKCEGKFVPEGEFGSDVEGKKPIVFDVGSWWRQG